MIRFLADEDFSSRLVRVLRRREPTLDVLRVQETPVAGRPDPEVLAWAAHQDRVVLTHDVATMGGFAYDRVARDEPMPGVLVVPQRFRRSRVVLDDLALIAGASGPGDWVGRVEYLPL